MDYSQTRGLPIYYSCDWDYDGLFVIYPLVKNKIPAIQILIPNGSFKGIGETEHASKWPAVLEIEELFTDEKCINIIDDLHRNEQWIIEESNDLMSMLSTRVTL